MTAQKLLQIVEHLKKGIPISQVAPVETTPAELEERMRETREWLVEECGYTEDSLWPDWYPPGALPPWYQKLRGDNDV